MNNVDAQQTDGDGEEGRVISLVALNTRGVGKDLEGSDLPALEKLKTTMAIVRRRA